MDDVLRTLERRAREDPADREAGWAYQLALGRQGQGRAQWTELVRGARRAAPLRGLVRLPARDPLHCVAGPLAPFPDELLVAAREEDAVVITRILET